MPNENDSRLRGRAAPGMVEDDTDQVTPPAGDLMAYLERTFPVELPNVNGSMEGIALDAAQRVGQQEVLTVLRTLFTRDHT